MNYDLLLRVWPGRDGMVEILVLTAGIYFLLTFLRGTRGAAVLTGLAVSLVLLYGLVNFLGLLTLGWILQGFLVYLAISMVVIFQPEIRWALAELGRRPRWGKAAAEERSAMIDDIVEAVSTLSDKKIGALIAIERHIGIRGIRETGTPVDSALSPELLGSLFFPKSPLHDGGVVVKDGRIQAAGCVFPLSGRAELSRTLGTRHRAAVGLTEECDALVVVVSEETGNISVAFNGQLRRGLDPPSLRRILHSILSRASALAPARGAEAAAAEEILAGEVAE